MDITGFLVLASVQVQSSYNMRAFDDGRFLETAMNLSEDAKRVAWVLPSENSGPVR